MSIIQLAAEVLRLDEITTPKPWQRLDQRRDCVIAAVPQDDSTIHTIVTCHGDPDVAYPNAIAIATYRTAAPELARFVRLVEQVLHESTSPDGNLSVAEALNVIATALRPSLLSCIEPHS